MSRARHARRAARGSKLVAERFLRQRVFVGTGNECEITAGSSLQGFGERAENGQRNRYDITSLFSLERRNTVAHMLAPDPHGVAAAQAGVKQHVEPHTLPRADR